MNNVSIMKNPIIEEILKIALLVAHSKLVTWSWTHPSDRLEPGPWLRPKLWYQGLRYSVLWCLRPLLRSWRSRGKICKNALTHLNASIAVVNEARVHLWYRGHFGFSIEQYNSAEDAISNWPATATSIGVKCSEFGNFVVCAPFGLEYLFELVVRPNKKQIT